ncbi:MAG TPA: SGNH/GDSL hydrolase family protein [Gaiellaceae bacterium]|nr:SGNH/GDSL hydrolase family protein [Gaiellaceae bacterium]
MASGAATGRLAELPLERLGGLVRGALSLARTPAGLVPVRAAERAFAQMPDPFTRSVFRMPSGVRLAFTTDATVLELDVAVSPLVFEEPGGSPTPVFDLLVDGLDRESRPVEGAAGPDAPGDDLFAGPPRPTVTLRFGDLPAGAKAVELWLPQNAVVELRALRADAPVAPVDERRPRWIHYGSSISHCVEARRPTETWPALAARLAGLDLLNLGVAGNCHLDQFVARSIRDEPAECISLKVGINIAGGETLKHRTFGPALHGFLDTVRDGHPDTPILLVSPVYCRHLEESPAALPEGSLSLARMRELLAEIAAARAADGERIDYLDGLRLFGEADAGDLRDGVHPTPEGYLRIGERFAAAAFRDGFLAPALRP